MKRIPKNWTFNSPSVAGGFNAHVREQLPWYSLTTDAVAHIARHYIPPGGLVYDVGASTGNIGLAIADTLAQRNARLVAIEEAPEMARHYKGGGELVICDAMQYGFEPFDFAVCFLVLMFLPVKTRGEFVRQLRGLIQPGGALVIVDKVPTPGGYAGTVLRRLAMRAKLAAGAPADQVLAKELSLAGFQRPISPEILQPAEKFFQFGEFAGWIIEGPAE